MKEFTYKIKDEVGIHARPAGYLAKKSKEFESVVTIEKNGKKATASKLMAVMSICGEQGAEATVTIEGNDEEKASGEIKKFFEENL